VAVLSPTFCLSYIYWRCMAFSEGVLLEWTKGNIQWNFTQLYWKLWKRSNKNWLKDGQFQEYRISEEIQNSRNIRLIFTAIPTILLKNIVLWKQYPFNVNILSCYITTLSSYKIMILRIFLSIPEHLPIYPCLWFTIVLRTPLY